MDCTARIKKANSTHRCAPARLVDAVALLALALLALAFFYKIALTNRVLAGLDLFAYFYPYRDFVSQALRSGHLPTWNPYLFMGAPMLANSQAAVLYPLHWPFIWLSAPKQVAWSIVLHIWLAAAGTYLFARRQTGLRPLPSFSAAAVFSLGGFLGAQVEHMNQLNASAWLPWLLICLEGTGNRQRRWPNLLAGGAIVGLILLAGHTQAAFIVLFGAGVYTLAHGFMAPRCLLKKSGEVGVFVRGDAAHKYPHFQFLRRYAPREQRWRAGLGGLAALALMTVVGTVLAAGQLLPTLELSRLSVRSGGLPYNEAASFSLKPGLIFKAFLPPLLWEPPFSEYVAYVGLGGLALAALGAWLVLRKRRGGGEALALAAVGVFLAFGAYNPVYYLLYRLVPGFALFRVPARWLLLYSFGTAILAGIGLQALSRLRSLRAVVILLLLLELLVASRRLAYNEPTAPAAVDSLRTAPAHLLADTSGEPFRFLSLSDILYDPGDLADIQAMYAGQLSEKEIYSLIVATKMKEVLAYNLPLGYRLFSVDGYDGGLLPTANYVDLERLFLRDDEIWPDGRLRQQLRQVPPARLLSLLNVKYIITDKTQDVWIDSVFYDLEHTESLGQVTLVDLPDFQTTDLGVVSYLTGTATLADGTPVAQVVVTDTQGATMAMTLRAGEDSAEGLYKAGSMAHRQARIAHHWRDNEQGTDYLTLLDLGRPVHLAAIAVRSLLPDGEVRLRGLTLIDRKTNTSRALSVDPSYRLVHSGDVKIYQNLAVLPRAFVVHKIRAASDAEAALAALRDPSFDPGREVILAQGKDLPAEGGQSNVQILSYEPEKIQLQVELDAPGYLVLTDAYYPGWVATVDGQATAIERADLYFRAVALGPGDHEVTFEYRSQAVWWGSRLWLSGWLAWAVVTAIAIARTGRTGPSSV